MWLLMLDLRSIYMMVAALYVMLHGALWLGMARQHQGRLVAIWSTSGILSAGGVIFFASRGYWPDWTIAVFGQMFMLLGNLGRQWTLRSVLPTSPRSWLIRMSVVNAVYMLCNGTLFFSGAADAPMLLVFFAFYTFNALEFWQIAKLLHRSRQLSGVIALKATAVVLFVSLGVKTLALVSGWAQKGFYDVGWDQYVVVLGQFVGISLLNVGFIQVNFDQLHRQKQALSNQVQEREELIRQLTLSHKSAGMGALAASFAHELNQPLSANLWHAEWLQQQFGSSSVAQWDAQTLQQVTSHIVQDTQRAAEIIRKLRSLFRLSKGESHPLNLQELIQDVVDIIRLPAHGQQVRLELHAAPDLRVMGDPIQLQQVLLNLLNNALDALKGIERDDKHVRIDARIERAQILVDVTDNGWGIPAEFQDHVFSLFKTSKSEGMGVGLWLSQSIMQSHHGTLTFESQVGVGTTFRMQFPADI